MPAGLQTFDSQGRLMLNLTTRHCRFYGSFDITGRAWNHSGTVSIPVFAEGNPFFLVVPHASLGRYGKLPVVRISGNGLFWHYLYTNYPQAYAANCTVHYGVY